MKKFGGLVLGVAVLAVLMVAGDWYRFTTGAQMTKNEGVYADPHLEVWIDINHAMPAPLRHWACKTLLTREAEVMGVAYEATLKSAPYSCHPEQENDTRSPQAAMFDTYVDASTAEASRRKANEGQLAAFKTCVTDHLKAAYTPEQLSASLSGKDPQASIALNQAMAKISSDCIAASGP